MNKIRLLMRQHGSSLIEVLISIAVLGMVGVSTLGALATVEKSLAIMKIRSAMNDIASSEIDTIKSQPYLMKYDVPKELTSVFTVTVVTHELSADFTRQMVTVTVHSPYPGVQDIELSDIKVKLPLPGLSK